MDAPSSNTKTNGKYDKLQNTDDLPNILAYTMTLELLNRPIHSIHSNKGQSNVQY
jgi:hypothetical protein